jgi:hypothetical protein
MFSSFDKFGDIAWPFFLKLIKKRNFEKYVSTEEWSVCFDNQLKW